MEKKKPKIIKKVLLVILVVYVVFCAAFMIAAMSMREEKSDEPNDTAGIVDTQAPVVTDDVSSDLKWNNGVVSADLAQSIQDALVEIGIEHKLKEITLDTTRETDLFITRIYRLDTSVYKYWIWTQEWKDGEPEKEEHPTEYLSAIKNWSPDGHMGTNLWAEDGSGSEQY